MTFSSIRHGLVWGLLMVAVMVGQLPAEPLDVGSLTAPPPEAKKTNTEVTKAIEQFKRRDYEGALATLREVVKKDSALPPAQIIMAQFFSQANQAAGVQASLERAVVEEPKDPEAYVLLGEMALRQHRVTEADLLFAKAAEFVPGVSNADRKKALEPRVYGGRAAVAQSRQDWPLAETYLRDWLKLDPKSAQAMERLGFVLFQEGKPRESLEQLKAAAEINPETLTPGARLALFYEQAGDHENAKKWMDYAIKVAPDDFQTQLVAGNWALNTGDVALAQTQAAKAKQLDPKSVNAKVLAGVVALFQKDYKAAEANFESALLQSPNSFEAKNNLAIALCEQDKEDKKRRALEYAEANVRQNPRVPEAVSTYGWVLYKLGRLNEAEKVFNQVVQMGNVSPDTAYYIARVAVDRGRVDDAKRILEGTLKGNARFSQRAEAEALLAQLSKTAPAESVPSGQASPADK